MYTLLGILLIPFLIGYFQEFRYVFSFFFQHLELYQYFLFGFGGYLILYLLLLRKRIVFWETLSHETIHAFFAALFFKKIAGLQATDDAGGETVYWAKSRNFIITLAPYFFPIYLVLLLGLGVLFNIVDLFAFRIILGVTGGFHFCANLRQLRPFQTDLKRKGLIFSYIFIFLMNIIIISCVLIILSSNWRECGQFFRNGLSHTLNVYQQGYALLLTLK